MTTALTETNREALRRVLSAMDEDAISLMYVRMVLSDEYLPVNEVGAELWDQLCMDYGERRAVHMVALHCRAHLGLGA